MCEFEHVQELKNCLNIRFVSICSTQRQNSKSIKAASSVGRALTPGRGRSAAAGGQETRLCIIAYNGAITKQVNVTLRFSYVALENTR